MRRFKTVIPALVAIAGVTLILAGAVFGAGPRALAQAQDAGWDCNPMILIGGHYHCSPPGGPSVQDIIDGTATTPSIVHQVFRPNGSFAGTETLIRADLFAGQRCPTDQWLPVPPWLPSPTYWACHHFQFTP
ncbi:MAG: hypothetical protein ACRDIL_19560 [Candidatus Limnocylindrales bacterium]